jgi:hypothetical protein
MACMIALFTIYCLLRNARDVIPRNECMNKISGVSIHVFSVSSIASWGIF